MSMYFKYINQSNTLIKPLNQRNTVIEMLIQLFCKV